MVVIVTSYRHRLTASSPSAESLKLNLMTAVGLAYKLQYKCVVSYVLHKFNKNKNVFKKSWKNKYHVPIFKQF